MCYVIAASILFIVLCFNGPLITWHGAILFSLIVLFLIESGRRMGSLSNSVTQDDTAIEQIDGVAGLPSATPAMAAFLIIGIIGLPIGAELIVSNATEIARAFDISEAAIGLTIIAFGTSLPELSTTFAAALRGHCGLAIGNVLGSNLFNILAVMGVTSLIAPVEIPETFLRYDLWVMLAATLAIAPFAMMRARITRIPATLLICAYGIYVYFVFTPNIATLTTAMR
jgi:cation:H+ antiporter